MSPSSVKIVVVLLSIAGCFVCGSKDSGDIAAVVSLSPHTPSAEVSMRWSPKGKQLILIEREGCLETELKLGSEELPPVLLSLEKWGDVKYYNRLFGDWNRNGSFEDDAVLEAVPSETRGKFWSSFETSIDIPVVDPKSGEPSANPYAISFWYVEDPLEPDQEKVIRFSRRGWMQGDTVLDGTPAVVMITEMEMDGIFDTKDSWALAEADNPKELYEADRSRSALNHAWLGEKAYKITAIHPSGREMKLEAYDPGITREEEERAMDTLAEDREAARSGNKVDFSHDYEESLKLSSEQGKLLFVDFETTWCGPCRTMDMYVYTADLTVKAFQDILAVKIDGDENRELVKKYDVKAYPTMIILSPEGEVVAKKVGYLSVKDLVSFVTTAKNLN